LDIELQQKLAQIVRTHRAAALGTIRNGAPIVTMVAYAVADDFSAFYVLTSHLSQHAQDMQKDQHVSLLIAETDDGREDVHGLARISIRGKAETLPFGAPGYTVARNLYLARFPKSEPNFELGDFDLWCITPRGARYIAGFARAFNLTPDAIQEAAAANPSGTLQT